VARFPVILPWNVGAIGFADAGRVYTGGASPGGWHTGAGGGLWLGVVEWSANGNILITNNPRRRVLFGLGFDF
jgi:hypothetical protein